MRDRSFRNKRNFRQLQPNYVDTQPNTLPREELKMQSQSPVQADTDTERDASVAVMSSSKDQQLPPPHSLYCAPTSPRNDLGEGLYLECTDAPTLAPDSLTEHHFPPLSPAYQSLAPPPLEGWWKSENEEKRNKGNKGKEKLESEESGSFSDLPNLPDVASRTNISRPSIVTVDDLFARGLRHVTPDVFRRNEWSFIRNRERVSFPPREPNGNRRYWDVWRCSQIGQIRVERVTLLPPCTYVSVPFVCIC